MSGSRYGPQASRMVGRVLIGARGERESDVLDLLRDRGPMTAREVRDAFGHLVDTTVRLYLTNLVEAGLVETRKRGVKGYPYEYVVTAHGQASP